MKTQQRPSLLAFSALLLCTLHHRAGSHRSSSSSSSSPSSSSSSSSTSEEAGRDNVAPDWLRRNNISSGYGNHSRESRPKLKEVTSSNTSRGNNTTVMSERTGGAPSWSPEDGPSPVCAYRVIEGGIGGQLCFRHTLFGFECHKADCRTAVSSGGLVANILTNGSVLLQWTHQGESAVTDGGKAKKAAAAGRTNSTEEGTLRSNTVFGGRRHRRGGSELSCWWNGSYTQFECAGVHLGSGCRDFLLAELHENIPYRICLRSLGRSEPAKRAEQQQRDCVEFTLPPSGMQDIVIAMTTVGGAICVMLVIICLLVAYITENIMSPTTQHAYSYRTHSRH